MKIKQSANELIIQDTPGCLWLFGLFFVLVSSVFVYGALGGFTDYDRVPGWVISISFFMGAIGIAVGVWHIYRAPITKVIVNRQAKTVTHANRGLFGREETIYGFDQVKQFRMVEGEDGEGDPIWSVGIEFYGGKIVEISTMDSFSKKRKQAVVFEANQFMQKQIPSYNSSVELED